MKNFFISLGLVGLLLNVLFVSSSAQDPVDPFEQPCLDDQFVCNITKACIIPNWRCDGDVDCSDEIDGKHIDRSDEENCPKLYTCTEDEFTCSSGHCIVKRFQCDGDPDCSDGSDERQEDCKKVVCKEDQFSCGDGVCIPASWRCDQQEDCKNGADEICTPQQITCAEDEFRCAKGHCITQGWVCDGDVDCGDNDNSDEKNCSQVCDSDQFRCNDNRCVPKLWQCDGDVDCDDQSDESNCNTTREGVCEAAEWMCHSGDQICIHDSWRCDGDPDCEDASDEKICPNSTCRKDQFQCADTRCIHDILRCDGFHDCVDGSDEVNCTKSPLKCNENQFDCNNDGTQCISLDNTCDHINDCDNYQDEDPVMCQEKNPCHTNNGGCLQTCVFLYHNRHRCDCHVGYKKLGNFSCADVNECLETDPPRCSQKCINTKGSYKCECELGYTFDHEQSFCKVNGERPWLLLANRHDLRLLHIKDKSMKPVAEDLQSSISADYDWKDNLTFWSDVALERILSIDQQGQIRTVVEKEIKTPDGIAVDWVYNHIYWTDTGFNTIDVSSYDGSVRKTLISTDLDEPRAIVVDPREGWMYWTDWGKVPKIERCGMDGTNRKVIVAQNISWPNGLTIDYVSRKLYWIDAKQNEIKSVNYDGSGVRTVIRDAEKVLHPFAITVFEDMLYWTDWSTDAVRAINKLTGLQYTQVEIGLHSPMDLHIHHEKAQIEYINYCPTTSRDRCSQLCLPAPHNSTTASSVKKYTCACSNGWDLASDGRSCVQKVIPTTTSSSQQKVSTTKKTTSPNDSHRTNNTGSPVIRTTPKADTPKPVTPKPVTPKPVTPKPGTQKPATNKPIVIEVSTDASGTYTVIGNNQSSTERAILNKPVENVGVVAGIAIAIVLGIAVIIILVGCIVYRKYTKRNIKSMNFDNPVYKKTVTDDQFMIQREQNREPAMEPLTAGSFDV